MGPVKKLVKEMRGHFNAQFKIRERLFDLSRRVVRNSAKAIISTHRGDEKSARGFIGQARKELKVLLKIAGGSPQFLTYGSVIMAQQEYAEAEIFRNLVEKGELLRPEKIGVSYLPYLGGLADVVGELRRRSLDEIRNGDVAGAESTLRQMEDLFEMLMEFDYPDAVLPGMKRKQDVARQVLEKTRGDMTVAIRQEKLEKALRKKK